MTRFTSPLSSHRRARALALGAAALALLALVRGSSPPPAATDRSPGFDGEVPGPRPDLQHLTETAVRSSSPRPRRRLSRALALVVAAGVVALLALVVGPASSRATIDWSSGFEGQSWSPWQGLQHQEDKPLSDSFQYVTSPVRTGSTAAQFSVPHGYGPYGGERTELCCGPTSEGTPGTDTWWGWSTMFPTNWTEPYHWGLFFQFHADDTMPPAITFDAGGDQVWVDVRTGNINGSETAYTNFPQILTSLAKGQWNDFVVHVNWEVGNTGTIQVWHRLAGDAGFVQVLNLTGIPTLQSRNGTSTGIYTKLGLYRDSYCSNPAPGCSSALGVQPTNSLYDDSVVHGSSFDEVVSAAWGGASAAVSSASSPPSAPAAPAPAAPAPAAPAPAAPAPAAPASTSAPASVSASTAKHLATNASNKGVANAETTSAVRYTQAVATAKAHVHTFATMAAAAGAKAHGYSLAAAALRAKARSYYRAAARAQARVRALTRSKALPIHGNTARPS